MRRKEEEKDANTVPKFSQLKWAWLFQWSFAYWLQSLPLFFFQFYFCSRCLTIFALRGSWCHWFLQSQVGIASILEETCLCSTPWGQGIYNYLPRFVSLNTDVETIFSERQLPFSVSAVKMANMFKRYPQRKHSFLSLMFPGIDCLPETETVQCLIKS